MANMQYLALITINRLYDVYVYHNLINPGRYNPCYIPSSRRQLDDANLLSDVESNSNNQSRAKKSSERSSSRPLLWSNLFRRASREHDEKRASAMSTGSTTTRQSSSNSTRETRRLGTGIGVRLTSKRRAPVSHQDNLGTGSSAHSTSSLGHSSKDSCADVTNPHLSKSHLLNADPFSTLSHDGVNPIYSYEPFSLVYQIEPIHFLRLMRTRLDAHRTEFNNRPKCVPSTRSPLCTHHCAVILAARILTILCQDHTFQSRLIGTKENLAIIVDMLNINNDPVSIPVCFRCRVGRLSVAVPIDESMSEVDVGRMST